MLFAERQLQVKGNRVQCMRNEIIALTLLLLFFCVGSANAQVQYDFTGFTSVSYSDLVDYPMTFNYTDSGTCKVRMQSYNTFTTLAGTFDSVLAWYSPRGTEIGSSPLEGLSNTSCETWGSTSLKSISKNATSNIYETKIAYTQAASSGRVTTTTQYVCDVNSADYLAKFTVDRAGDSLNYCQYRARKTSGVGAKSHTSWLNVLKNDYDACSDLTAWSYNHPACATTLSGSGGHDTTNQYIYPFNSSGGSINYAFTAPNVVINTGLSISGEYWIDLINVDDGTSTEIYTDNEVATVPGTIDRTFFADDAVSGTIPLEKDTQYLWVITWEMDTSNTWDLKVSEPPILKMEVYAYHSALSCGPYSECINGTKWRTCVDTNGIGPDEIQTAKCEVIVLENASFGFEDFEDIQATICQADWNVQTALWGLFTGTSCVHNPLNITVSRPLNWTVIGDSQNVKRHFMDMSHEWATEGTRSLRIWTIPPKQNEISDDGTVCQNQTTTPQVPSVRRAFSNTSLAVSFNVTFPATNMRLVFDTRKCLSQVEQYGDLVISIPTGIFGQLNLTTVCPKQCYGSSCETKPDASYLFNLIDSSGTSLTGHQFIDISTELPRAESQELDLSTLGLTVGENYTIIFEVYNQDTQGTTGNCIMIDNVRYDVLDQPFLSILNGICETDCDPSGNGDLIIARRLPNGGCMTRRERNSKDCMDPDIAAALQAGLSRCDPVRPNILLRVNNFTGLTTEIDCGPIGCDFDHCIIPEEEEDEPTYTTAEYLELAFSAPFLISLAILIGMIVLTAAMKMQGESFIFILFGVGQFLFFLSIEGVISIYVAVIEIFLGTAILAWYITGVARKN
jgi:hypothetical protein